MTKNNIVTLLIILGIIGSLYIYMTVQLKSTERVLGSVPAVTSVATVSSVTPTNTVQPTAVVVPPEPVEVDDGLTEGPAVISDDQGPVGD